MSRHPRFHLKLFAAAVLAFALASALFLVQRAVAGGMLQTVCETTAYALLAAAVLSLSYAVFVRGWHGDGTS